MISVYNTDEQRTALNRLFFPWGSNATRTAICPIGKGASALEVNDGGHDWACNPLCVSGPAGWIFSDFLLTVQKTENRWVSFPVAYGQCIYTAADKSIARSTSLEPWFDPHVQRNIYLSLLHLEPQPGEDKATPVPDSILKAALLQRAAEDIRRILEIRGAKQPLSQLLQRGSVGDDLWQRFLRAEKEMEAELRDVMEEVRTHIWVDGQSLTNLLGERSRYELGTDHLPKC